MIRCEGLGKDFGHTPCVVDLTLETRAGEVVGLVGCNGAGKTTTLRMLATLLEPSHGEAWVAGYSVLSQPELVRRHVGFMPDQFGRFDGLRSREYLEFFAGAYGIPRAEHPPLIRRLLEMTDLLDRQETLVTELSFGLKQRLCLAKTLLHDPPVLLLDEPASGLDPLARLRLRELIGRLAGQGKTVLVSSHILSDLVEICHKIAILEQGRLLAFGPTQEVCRGRLGLQTLRLRLLAPPEEQSRVEARLKAWPWTLELSWTPPYWQIETQASLEQQAELLGSLAQEGLQPVHFSEKTDLEDTFARLVSPDA